MRRRRTPGLPALLVGTGALLLAGTIGAWLALRGGNERRPPVAAPTVTAPPATTAPPPPPATTAPPPATTAPPPSVGLSWRAAGAFVWHPGDVDPTALGTLMRANGFGWLALRVADGLAADELDPGWIARFRSASGLPVGGWAVLRGEPEQEARLAAAQVARYGLDFYVADAEADYAYTGPPGDAGRDGRSQRFLRVFRSLLPSLPAGLSSYCRLDIAGVDWSAWRNAGFAFLPQAYVDQFGSEVDPSACVRAAAPYFPASTVHPTVGSFPVDGTPPSPEEYAELLRQAGTVGFSVYLAETNMPPESWRAYGQAIEALGIAAVP